MQLGFKGQGGCLLSLSLFPSFPSSPPPSLSLPPSPLTPHGAAGGSGCGGSERRASPAAIGSSPVACSPRSGSSCRSPAIRTACGRPVWRRWYRGPQRRSCFARRTLELDGPRPLRSLCPCSESPPTCVAAPLCCRPRGPALPRCPRRTHQELPPRNKSLVEQKRRSLI